MTGIRAALIVTVLLAGGRQATAEADQPPPGAAPAQPPGREEPPTAQPLASPPPLTTIPSVPEPPPASPPPLVRPPASEAGDPPASPDPTETEPSTSLPKEARFGDPGQVALNGALSASFGHLGYSSGGSASTSFSVEPAFDYFSSQNFSQGLSAFFRYTDSTSGIDIGETNVTFGVTAGVGSNLWLAERVSLWPKLSLGVWQSRTTFSAAGGGYVSVDGTPIALGPSTEVTENALFVELYAPFLIHPARHFFVGFGPDGYADVFHSANSVSNRRMFLGAESTLGGWF